MDEKAGKPRYKTETDLMDVLEDLLDEHGADRGFAAVGNRSDGQYGHFLTVWSDFGPAFQVSIMELDREEGTS